MDTPLFLSERIRVVSVMLMRDKNIKYEVTECARFCVSRYMLALLMERARNLTWWYVSPSLQEDEQFNESYTPKKNTTPSVCYSCLLLFGDMVYIILSEYCGYIPDPSSTSQLVVA